MATLIEYFNTDFKHSLRAHNYVSISVKEAQKKLTVIAKLHFDFDANVKYISYFVPQTKDVYLTCSYLVKNPNLALSIGTSFDAIGGRYGEQGIGSTEMKFSGRIFIYSETQLSKKESYTLFRLAKKEGIALIVRSKEYAKRRSEIEIPLAFISHDTRDKEEIATPLAIRLSSLMCPVWYDEFSLNVGDNLRESIERGIKECKKCILIISPNFLSNKGWTKKEFNSIFSRELIEKDTVILPVWHKVTKEDIYGYSPSLVDKYAAKWEEGIEIVAKKLYRAIMK